MSTPPATSCFTLAKSPAYAAAWMFPSTAPPQAAAIIATTGKCGRELFTIEDRKQGLVTVPRDQIHSAKLVLTDELIAATQPLDTSGADEIVETPDIPDEEKADD